MKRIIITLSMLMAVALTSVFANEGTDINQKVQAAFEKDFASAKNVKWNKDGEYLKASFTIADMLTDAYYTQDGELMGSARNLLFDQLPLAVIHEFNKRFNEASVLNVLEITNDEGTSYRLWIEQGNKKIKVRASGSGEIAILEKSKK
ncbi:MAG: hypothetical protein JWM28_784 [Chitinophagaceae bacterium]|nr:hypothetical protein [Chitinophagaceae bacterium]